MTAIPSIAVVLDGSFCQYCSTTPRLTRSSRSEHHVSKLRDCTARSITSIRLTSAHPCKPLNYLHAYNCQPSRTLGWVLQGRHTVEQPAADISTAASRETNADRIYFLLTPRGTTLISSKRGRKQLHEASGGSYPPIFSYLKICSSVSLSVSPYSLVFCIKSLRIPECRPLMIDLLVHVFSSSSVLYRFGDTEKNSGDCFVQKKKGELIKRGPYGMNSCVLGKIPWFKSASTSLKLTLANAPNLGLGIVHL